MGFFPPNGNIYVFVWAISDMINNNINVIIWNVMMSRYNTVCGVFLGTYLCNLQKKLSGTTWEIYETIVRPPPPPPSPIHPWLCTLFSLPLQDPLLPPRQYTLRCTRQHPLESIPHRTPTYGTQWCNAKKEDLSVYRDNLIPLYGRTFPWHAIIGHNNVMISRRKMSWHQRGVGIKLYSRE